MDTDQHSSEQEYIQDFYGSCVLGSACLCLRTKSWKGVTCDLWTPSTAKNMTELLAHAKEENRRERASRGR
jgi:hypothetical protein